SDESSNDLSHYAEKILTSSLTTVFFPILYIIIFIVGVPTNAMALWVFIFRAKKRHPASIYMANLALADLLFAIWIPLKIVLVSFFYSNMYCSILFMTCLSVQRYWVIVNPMSHQRKNTSVAIGISISIWLLIVLSTIPLFMQKQTIHLAQLNITTCHDVLEEEDMTLNMFGYFLSMAIGAFFFPAILTIVAYVLMILTLTGSMKDDNIGKKRKKAIRLIIIVLVMYLVCLPPATSSWSFTMPKFWSNNDALYAVYITALCLSSLNSCIDPFVYYFVLKKATGQWKELLCKFKPHKNELKVQFKLINSRS
uniref:Coagulation factor II (thrombin) receptor-like 1, tandem duplicate 2 n=1 Tax=Erpetoichthys calabaricus TaxID=27687 RepID=A0A8C4X601_ERPCA